MALPLLELPRQTGCEATRVTRDQAREFWARVEVLLSEFAQLPRTGDTVYGFAVGLYPTEHPTLPEPEVDEASR